MKAAKNLTILILSNYMICPPISGGVKRILFPAMNFTEDDNVRLTHLYLDYSNEKIAANNSFIEKYPVVKKVRGILTTWDTQFDWSNIPDGLASQTWYTINQKFLQAAIEELRSHDYDIVQIIHSQFAWLVPHLRMETDAKFVMDCQNLEWLVYKRWIPYAKDWDLERVKNDYLTLKKWEETVLSWFDYIFCISGEELEIVQEMAPNTKVLYVPSGASIDDAKYYPPAETVEKEYDLFFIGSMNWYPNAHALIWLLDEVFPIILKRRPSTKLEVVGSGEPDEEMLSRIKNYKSVTFWGSVEDERPLFHKSRVFVSPIWIGAGVRLKNPTAWASKLPVVATSLSAEGLDYTDGHDILIADTPEDFAERVLELLDSPQKCKALADRAYETYKARYCKEVLIHTWLEAYNQVYHNQ